MADAGADVLVARLGLTTGGVIGADQEHAPLQVDPRPVEVRDERPPTTARRR